MSKTCFLCVVLQVVVEQDGQPRVRLLIAVAAGAETRPAGTALADSAASHMCLSSTASCSHGVAAEGPAASSAAASTPEQQLPSSEVSSAAHCCLACLELYSVLSCLLSGAYSNCEQHWILPPEALNLMRLHVFVCPAGGVMQQQQSLL
jgi:hypothetical protein